MLKGITKSVIMVKTDSKSRFEAVYFVLKREASGSRGDMVKEANKIIGECRLREKTGGKWLRWSYLLALLVGAILGAIGTFAVCFCILP